MYWAGGLALGLPFLLISLTEWHNFLARRHSALARPVNLLRHYIVPLAALLVLLVEVAQVPAQFDSVRLLATVFGFVVLLLLLSGLNATVFEGAPEGTWRKRVPTIFRDVTRFLLIAIGLALILSYVWGVRVAGLFTALGVTSVVIGLMLQNSVGQIVSGLFMLFEQPSGLATGWTLQLRAAASWKRTGVPSISRPATDCRSRRTRCWLPPRSPT